MAAPVRSSPDNSPAGQPSPPPAHPSPNSATAPPAAAAHRPAQTSTTGSAYRAARSQYPLPALQSLASLSQRERHAPGRPGSPRSTPCCKSPPVSRPPTPPAAALQTSGWPCPRPCASFYLRQARSRKSAGRAAQRPLLLPCSNQFEEPQNRFDPAMKIRQVELLVRSMKIVIRQSKAHHHRRNPQLAHKVADDWNRPTAAHKDGFFTENLLHRRTRRAHVRIVRANHNRLALMDQPSFQRDARRTNALHIRLVQRKRLLRLHVRHQPERNLRRGLRRDHRLRARADKPARHAMYIHRRTRPRAFQYREHHLAGQLFRPHLCLPIVFFIERQRPPRFQLGL